MSAQIPLVLPSYCNEKKKEMSLKHLGSQSPELRRQDRDSNMRQGFRAHTLNHYIPLFLSENKNDRNILKDASHLGCEGQRPV